MDKHGKVYLELLLNSRSFKRAFGQKIDVKYICFHHELDGVEHPDDLGQTMPFEEDTER